MNLLFGGTLASCCELKEEIWFKSNKIMNKYLLFVMFVLAAFAVQAQKPELRYNASGKFKIVQFTDVHSMYGDPKSDIAYDRINQVIDVEKPDLVIFTGDVIFSPPALPNLEKVLKLVNDKKVPFAMVFGNHDAEQKTSRDSLLMAENSFSYCLSTDEQPEITGVGNYALSVLSRSGKVANVLWCLDSNDYSKIDSVDGYGYIHRDQIEWYVHRSLGFTKANNGTPLPSLAFFHIPLPEYAEALATLTTQVYGIRREIPCNSQLNSGMFTAMKECGDVMGVFVGHDHNNDFMLQWKGIALAYGRFSGGENIYCDIPNGARVIELTEGSRSFHSWIRTAAGTEQDLVYPDCFWKAKD